MFGDEERIAFGDHRLSSRSYLIEEGIPCQLVPALTPGEHGGCSGYLVATAWPALERGARRLTENLASWPTPSFVGRTRHARRSS